MKGIINSLEEDVIESFLINCSWKKTAEGVDVGE
jgi:hypothetical protein